MYIYELCEILIRVLLFADHILKTYITALTLLIQIQQR